MKRWVFGCLSRLVDHAPSLCPLSGNHASGESRFEALERAAYHEETCRGDLEGEREDESRDPKRHSVILLERGILVPAEGYGRGGGGSRPRFPVEWVSWFKRLREEGTHTWLRDRSLALHEVRMEGCLEG